MKVLLVSEPGENGVFRHVEDLADHLIAMGHCVNLAYSDVRGSDRLCGLLERVRSSGGQTENLCVSSGLQLGDASALLRLWGLYRRVSPDVVHAHSAKAGGLARLLHQLGAKAPVLYTPHAYYGMGRPRSLAVRFFTFVEKCLAPGTLTINLSPEEAEYGRDVLRVAPEAQRLIPNGVDTRHFRPGTEPERHALRSELGIPASAVVLGTLGRFSYQKDPLTLHKAFRACADRMPNLHLVHVGAGEQKAEVQQYARVHGYDHRVTWIEYLRDPAPFYRLLDCFILTSRYEGLSFAALEALATDLPVVLSDAPGNRGFGALGLSHLWNARVEYPASFASAITSWYDDRSHGRACNHRDVAVSRLSREVQLMDIEAAYEELCGVPVRRRSIHAVGS